MGVCTYLPTYDTYVPTTYRRLTFAVTSLVTYLYLAEQFSTHAEEKETSKLTAWVPSNSSQTRLKTLSVTSGYSYIVAGALRYSK